MIIKMTQNMDCQQICRVIQKIVNRYASEGKVITDNHALSVDIVEMTEVNPPLPKLEHINGTDSDI